MISAALGAVAVMLTGFALRPQPAMRRPIPGSAPSAVPARWRGSILERLGHRMRVRRRRRQTVTPFDVATWCEGLARAVRSGATLSGALRSADAPASCRSERDRIVLTLDRGGSVADAAATDSGSPHLDVALVVLRACATHGGAAAEPLDRAAMTLRGRAADDAERRTQSAQARMSAVVMTVLPAAMLALLLATSSTTRDAVASPVGATAIVIGAALNLAGWRWMRHMIAAGPR